jgi:hypothetical protein
MSRVTDHQVEDWVDWAARSAEQEDQSEWEDEFAWRIPEEIEDKEAQINWLWENAREILEDELEEALAEVHATNRADWQDYRYD